MLVEVLTFLRALPALVRAVERLADVGTALAAQQRKDEKDQLVIDLIAAARERRMRQREAGRVSGDSGSPPEGHGDGSGI